MASFRHRVVHQSPFRSSRVGCRSPRMLSTCARPAAAQSAAKGGRAAQDAPGAVLHSFESYYIEETLCFQELHQFPFKNITLGKIQKTKQPYAAEIDHVLLRLTAPTTFTTSARFQTFRPCFAGCRCHCDPAAAIEADAHAFQAQGCTLRRTLGTAAAEATRRKKRHPEWKTAESAEAQAWDTADHRVLPAAPAPRCAGALPWIMASLLIAAGCLTGRRLLRARNL